jgi:hypothetical protein
MGQLTDLLGRVQGGDAEARDALFAAAYAELHGLARGRLRHGGRHTFWTRPVWCTSRICDSRVRESFVPRTDAPSSPTRRK